MVKIIGIIDIGNSNVLSVLRAVEKHTTARCLICNHPDQLKNVDKLIIPGVGAFPEGMQRLQKIGFDVAIKEFVRSGAPILGICLGMQLLASVGHEFSMCNGLGIIEGTVEKLNTQHVDGHKLVIPYVGWAEIQINDTKHPILTHVFNRKSFYFVHSYQFKTKKNTETIATYSYANDRIPAVIAKQNVLGVQFHPEKSGEVGLRLLENFIEGSTN